MPVLTLAEASLPPNYDQVRAAWLTYFDATGFPITNWEDGGAFRTLFEVMVLRDAAQIARNADQARAFFNGLSEGDYLTHFSASFYANTQLPAIPTFGKFLLTDTTGDGPWSPGVGDILVKFGDLIFELVEAGTIPQSGSESLTFKCLTAGTVGNIPNASALEGQSIPVGVTATNPAYSGGTWITTLGRDAESANRLRLRNSLKWSLNAAETVVDRCKLIALEAVSTIEKVEVDDQNPRGDGTVDVYIAGDLATAGATDVTTVQAALEGRFFGDAQSRLQVYAAPTQALDVTGTVYYRPHFAAADVQTAVEAALNNFIRGILLGGLDVASGLTDIVPLNDVEGAILNAKIADVACARHVVLSAPAGNTAVGGFKLVVPGTYTITYTPALS